MLLRHAKSSWEDPTQEDHDRTLNERGQKAALATGNWLRGAGLLPDQVLCSTATRAVETWERLGLTADLHFLSALYLARPDVMLRYLSNATGDRVLMVGHNPGIAELADRLTATPPEHGRFYDYPTAALLILQFDTASWTMLETRSGQCLSFTIPADRNAP